jgi:tetratricopeptide (TPR) repeat protein
LEDPLAKKIKITRKEIKQDDEFITFIRDVIYRLSPYAKYFYYALAGLAAAALIYFAVDYYLKFVSARAQTELAKAETVFQSPVVSEKQLQANPNIKRMYPDISTSDREKYQKALEKFDAVISKYAKTSQGVVAMFYKAVTLNHLSRFEEAATAYEEFLKAAPANHAFRTLAHVGMGSCQESAGKVEDALASYQKAAADESDPADRGNALMAIARIQESRKDYKAAAETLASFLKSTTDAEDKTSLEHRIENLKKLAGS